MDSAYLAAGRDIDFVLWEQLRLEEKVLAHAKFQHCDRAMAADILHRTRDFACGVLGSLYQSSDREGCRLQPNGHVGLPTGFLEAWQVYQHNGWNMLAIPLEDGGLALPYPVTIAVQEMLYGANPAFMTLSGFCVPLFYLIRRFGGATLQALFCEKLARGQWSACLCMTEPAAGSDVGAIRTRVEPRQDGSYRLAGTKIFISAGSHDLAENIVYVVLARIAGAPPGTAGLSCFLVPRFRFDASGRIDGDNHVSCERLENKMGLHGCPTAELTFGSHGESVAYLLGDRPNRGLLQLLSMMNQARITTGVFALGMASSAYLHAARYACERVQGSDQRLSFSASAPRVRIVQHADVRRMLLEMKSTVEGCRAVVYKLAAYVCMTQLADVGESNAAGARGAGAMVDLLTPIAKAYVSDQAWRVAELAIQVHGGYGYTRDCPVEQYARDIKILSIWEGTNYLQAADLIRDKLGFGARPALLEALRDQIRGSLPDLVAAELQPLRRQLDAALDRIGETLSLTAEWSRKGRIDFVLSHATRILRMFAHVVLGWLLLEGAVIAQRALQRIAPGAGGGEFYAGKILSARFFFANLLPSVAADAAIIGGADFTVVETSPEVFAVGAGQ
jgi:acyl-CoA dehydrogenase